MAQGAFLCSVDKHVHSNQKPSLEVRAVHAQETKVSWPMECLAPKRSLVPRPLPAFQCNIEKLGVAWGRGYLNVRCHTRRAHGMLEMMESSRVSDDIILNSLNRPLSSSVTSYYNYVRYSIERSYEFAQRSSSQTMWHSLCIKQGTLVAWKSLNRGLCECA